MSRSWSGWLVATFGLLGVLLIAAPWTRLWDEATRALLAEPITGWMLSGWVRGGVSAIGLLDVWVAVQLYRERMEGGPAPV